jgi:hypothetical protein
MVYYYHIDIDKWTQGGRTPEEEVQWQEFVAYCLDKYATLDKRGQPDYYRAMKPLYNLNVLLDPDSDLENKIAAVKRLLRFESIADPFAIPAYLRHPGGRPGVDESVHDHFRRMLKLITQRLFRESKKRPTQTEVMHEWPEPITKSTFQRRLNAMRDQGECKNWVDYLNKTLSISTL